MRFRYVFWMPTVLQLGAWLAQPNALAEDTATKTSAAQYTINFNSRQSLGELWCYTCGQNKKSQSMTARGTNLGAAKDTVTVTIPSGKRLGLNLNARALSNPELLDKITPNLLDGLIIQASAIGDDEAEDQRITKVILHLGGFTHLKELFVDRSDTNDAQLAGLPVLKSLERISAFCDLSLLGTSLQRLSQFPNLHSISLWHTSFDGKNLALLKGLKKLDYLDLAETNLHGYLKYLPPCPALKQLDISSTHVTDDELKYLLQLKNLKFLDLNNCKISDKGLPVLTGLQKLRGLDVRATGVTIGGVIDLAKKMNLSQLSITDRHFTATERQQLKDHCPSVEFAPPPKARVPTKELEQIFAPISRPGRL